MFLDIAPSELMLVAFVALVVIGPKDLPKAMRVVGYWVGKARGVARQFRSGFDSMVREAELEEMEKRWAAENERIMREHPPTPAPASMDVRHDGMPASSAADPLPHSNTSSHHDTPVDGASHWSPVEHPPIHVEKPVVTAAPDMPQVPADDSLHAGKAPS